MFGRRRGFPFFTVVAAIAGCSLLIFISLGDRERERLELSKYCSMVDSHRKTGGEHGWPDYRKIYDEQCPVGGER